jgi:hypothetical protein
VLRLGEVKGEREREETSGRIGERQDEGKRVYEDQKGRGWKEYRAEKIAQRHESRRIRRMKSQTSKTSGEKSGWLSRKKRERAEQNDRPNRHRTRRAGESARWK